VNWHKCIRQGFRSSIDGSQVCVLKHRGV
jgi:hypothetical protein